MGTKERTSLCGVLEAVTGDEMASFCPLQAANISRRLNDKLGQAMAYPANCVEQFSFDAEHD